MKKLCFLWIGLLIVTCNVRGAGGVIIPPLSIRCPADITTWTCNPNGAAVTFQPQVLGGCPPVLAACNPPSGSVFPVGTTAVVCGVRDACNQEDRCEFKVTVVLDTERPRIRCPDPIEKWVCDTKDAVVEYEVQVTDDCDTNVAVICLPPSGSLFPVGDTVVTCRAIDDCGNISGCEFKVKIVLDTEPPRIICPDDIRRWICDTNAVIDYTVLVTDDCDTNVTVICDPPSGSLFPVGDTVVSCRARDDCGNMNGCQFKVSLIQDVERPRIVCPDDIRKVICDSNAVVEYTVTATDDCDTNVLIVCNPPSGSAFPVGTTVVTCRAIDDCQHISVCEFKVSLVQDTEPPRIVCPPDIRRCICSSNAVIEYTVTATDDFDADVEIVCFPPSGSSFPTGVTTVNCRARDDCGNLSACSFTITLMQDTTPPTLVCPPDMRRWTCDANGMRVEYPPPTATDNCDDDVAMVCNPPSGSAFPVGATIVECHARDNCGNASKCEFRVSVLLDTEPPQLTCPTNLVVRTCLSNAPVRYTVTATDNADPDPEIFCDPPSGTVLPVGTNVVVCVARDRCGNRSECSFEVRVVQVRPPQLTIRRLEEGRVAVCWESDYPCWRLQFTKSLNLPVEWHDVTDPVLSTGDRHCIVLPVNERIRFFRLYCDDRCLADPGPGVIDHLSIFTP